MSSLSSIGDPFKLRTSFQLGSPGGFLENLMFGFLFSEMWVFALFTLIHCLPVSGKTLIVAGQKENRGSLYLEIGKCSGQAKSKDSMACK